MYEITSTSGKPSAYVTEFVADTIADVAELPVYPSCAPGSTCIVTETSTVYMLSADNTWHEL